MIKSAWRVPVAGVAMFLLAIGVAAPAGASPDSASLAEQYLLAAANQERAQRGLQQLHWDAKLARAAAQHAMQMAEHGGISHQFPGEPELTQRGAAEGVAFSEISENVAEAPNAVEIHGMWMNSEHHRENLLDPAIDAAGISVVQRNGEFYAVEDFARTTRAASFDDQEAAIGALVRKQAPVALLRTPTAVTDARTTCSMDTGYAGAQKPWFIMRFTAASLTQLPDELNAKLATGKYHQAAVGACAGDGSSPFTSYSIAVLLYP